MYSVVGCSNCESVKIVEGRPKTTTCHSCGKTLKFDSLRVFHETDDLEEAKEARSLMLAKRNDMETLYNGLMEEDVFNTKVEENFGEDELLDEKGVDTEEIKEARERKSSKSGVSKPQKRIVMDAVENIESPTDDDIIEYARQRGVDEERTEEIIDSMCIEGEAMRQRDGSIRLV
ncbi:DUF5817 domain-containing protein [Halorutilales archaeon Cl-col2-1]